MISSLAAKRALNTVRSKGSSFNTAACCRSFAAFHSPPNLRPPTATIGTPVNHHIPDGIPIFTHHPSAPEFIGFSKLPPPPTPMAEEEADADSIVDTVMMTAPPQDANASANNTESNETAPAMELKKSNRNNRSSKNKANHGKRPCNRQGRRARKIKIGRRKRS